MEKLSIYNTLSKQKEVFSPINAPFVGMYVCGPTVYSDVHLGNCRTFISFDMVYRYLSHLGYQVRYVRNITDAGHLENDADEGEDKISKKARLEKLEPMEIVQRYTLGFHDVLAKFNNIPPTIEPTATGHIVEQIDMIETIIEKGLAYEVNGSVYFDVNKYNENVSYGILSGRNIEDLISGTRELDGQSEKRNALDFALWKKASPEHIMQWNSPWGKGFPGWHLECSVMSSKYLGERFDIHGGGMDLKFPHHECEIAQCQAAHGDSPVNVWMHANMLTLNGAKMSKSTGNHFLPHELFTGDHELLDKAYAPAVVRFFMMQAHYRSTLDFSNEALHGAEKGYHKLMDAIAALDAMEAADSSNIAIDSISEKVYAAMNDDFNTPVLVANLFDGLKTINALKSGKAQLNQEDLNTLRNLYRTFVIDILGVLPPEEKGTDDGLADDVMQVVLKLRQSAKENKDWTTADQIRDELNKLNISVKDSKDGSTWEINS